MIIPTLTLLQNVTAVGPNIPASFAGAGGSGIYTYSVRSGGAGGSIDASTGAYVAPSVAASDGPQLYDTILVTDSFGAKAQAQILVGSALLLLCDIIQNQLGLPNGRVYLWDQKLTQPSDSDLYIAVSEMSVKAFSNNNSTVSSGGGLNSVQYTNLNSKVDIDIISRGPAARDRKGEVLLAFNSTYAQQQQDTNSFYIGKLPPGAQFVNLSQIDGGAIPYRYKISIVLQYCVSKTVPIQSYDDFLTPSVVVNQ